MLGAAAIPITLHAANPFLPSYEYIPDGEPRVFGDRVYLYGSHDKAGSRRFCDYILKVWSAPLTNLNVWTDQQADRRHPLVCIHKGHPMIHPERAGKLS
jgi:hypothetical protein